MEDSSTFVEHVPCASCGSSDANSVYDDGHHYCFACNTYVPGGDETVNGEKVRRSVNKGVEFTGTPMAFPKRGLTQATSEHFGYVVGSFAGKTAQFAPYYNADGALVAAKVRMPGKEFAVLGGSAINDALPFGAHKWPRTGKKIVVTEGELDAMAMSQVQGNRWPVVSIASGAGPQVRKYIAKHRDYFNSFDEVVIMFDNDEPGIQAARIAAEVIGRKAKIARLPDGIKDPCDALASGKTEELITAMWRAEEYRPSGIVQLSDLRDEVMRGVEPGDPWCFPALTEMTYGRRRGEIYCLGGGTGIGKTSFLTQQVEYDIATLKKDVAVFFLEQEPRETGLRVVGKHAQKVFHIPDRYDPADLEAAFEAFNSPNNGRLFLYDSFGINEWDTIRERIRFLYHAEGIQYVYLDHLTALAAAEHDERKALEQIMAQMGGLVKELGITLMIVSHLATPDGKPHEEGGRVMIRHLKGSRAIGFWCHYIFALERDQQDPNQDWTDFRCLKDRYTGEATGEVFRIGYNFETGMLFEMGSMTATASPFEEGESDDF